MHDDRIERYVAGDMTEAERLEFERTLETDPALRDEAAGLHALMNEARDWMNAPAPGVERAAAIPIPALQPKRTARVLPAVWAWRIAAVLAVFFAGYWLGGRNTTPTAAPETALPPQPRIEEAQPVHADNSSGAVIAQQTEPYRAREENGRVIIETASAYWVIDPGMSRVQTATAN